MCFLNFASAELFQHSDQDYLLSMGSNNQLHMILQKAYIAF